MPHSGLLGGSDNFSALLLRAFQHLAEVSVTESERNVVRSEG